MLSKISKVICIYSILLCVACGSSGQSLKDSMPGVEIPLEKMNTNMKLEDYPGQQNSYKNNKTFNFIIINLSDSRIFIQFETNIKIFARQGNLWKSVTNSLRYSDGGGIYLDPEKYKPGGEIGLIKPEILNLTEPITIRVVVEGKLQDTKEPVGAFIDFVLKP